MTIRFPPAKLQCRDGSEQFHRASRPIGRTVHDLWCWASSDLLSNTMRAVAAEFLVATAIGADTSRPREPWATFDLTSSTGIKVEVKASGYLQSWAQSDYSSISFDVKCTRAWDPATNQYVGEPCRHADVYVFALLAHRDKDTADPLDVGQWEFYVLSTPVLNARTRSQTSITLASLVRLHAGPHAFESLADAVALAAQESP